MGSHEDSRVEETEGTPADLGSTSRGMVELESNDRGEMCLRRVCGTLGSPLLSLWDLSRVRP